MSDSATHAGTAVTQPLPHEVTPRRRVLLACTGLSPQIVTETLYALAVQQPPWVPHEVRLLTTAEGAERARLALLSDSAGWFARLCKDYQLPPIRFDESCIITVNDGHNQPLEDILTPEHNRRVADLITETVRHLTQGETELHVSIAGGRKTMGFYLGYALSLFGRPWDKLSHVLVSEPFESSWDFFYPTPYSKVISTPNNKLADTSKARISLAEIPYVSLREGLPRRLRNGQASFSQTVAAARKALQPPSLRVDLSNGWIEAAGERFSLADAHFGFYAWFAYRCQQELEPFRWTDEVDMAAFFEFYEARCGQLSQRVESLRNKLRDGIDKDWFDQRRSKTNAAIAKALGDQLAKPYLIHGQGPRSQTRYSLNLPPDAIRFEPVEGATDE